MLVAVTFIKGRCGYERDGSFSTKKEDRWQMFDTGMLRCRLSVLLQKRKGLGTVIMGIFDEDGIAEPFRHSRRTRACSTDCSWMACHRPGSSKTQDPWMTLLQFR